jgi:galactokinase
VSPPPEVIEAFARRFGGRPAWLARSPGRVNLVGEHTDYNEGFVLPMAIDRAAWIAFRPRPDGRVHLFSLQFDQATEFDLAGLSRTGPAWAEYVKGVAWSLREEGRALRGFDGVLAGDVPMGAGLSSSAAVELAAARALAASSALAWEPRPMALRAQHAENSWVGMKCGIMDQLVSAAAVAGSALLIDCRSLATTPVPLPPGAAVVVLDTSTRRALVGSAYNERRAQCEEAARGLGVRALRDVTVEQLARSGAPLEATVRRRARHVVAENARTLAAAEAMRRGDAATLGRLLDASHQSLREDFEVSSPALEAMVACAQGDGAAYGARLTGAGFGGCAVALVRGADAEAVSARVSAAYRERTGLTPQAYVCGPAGGASLEALA